MKEGIVIIIDDSQYKKDFVEELPFKAKVIDIFENEVIVKSLKTNIEYEFYHWQVLENLDLEKLKKIINVDIISKL